jgi:hypothetical protein
MLKLFAGPRAGRQARIIPLNRPIRPPIDWSREISQAEQDAHARYRAERKARRDEFLKTWTPPYPEPADPESEESTVWSCIESAAFACRELQRVGENITAATAPHWVNHVEDLWLTSIDGDNTGILEREPTAASVTLSFLMQGGEFALTFESEKYQEPIGIKTRILSSKRLRVRSEHGIHFGAVHSDCGEMYYDIVMLPGGAPQDVADRVASAYGKIVQLDMPNDYAAVMPLCETCMFCGRPFSDQISKVIGIGPCLLQSDAAAAQPRDRKPHSATTQTAPRGGRVMSDELEAEIIFDNQVNADAAEIALREAGYVVAQRPDWSADCGGECAWLTATAIAVDVHAFAERVRAIIESYDGTIWVCGPHWFNAAYALDLEEPGYLQ